LRDELDVAEVLRLVVQPVVGALLRPGELDSISVEWATVRVLDRRPPRSDGGGNSASVEVRGLTADEVAGLRWTEVVRLVVRLQAKGEVLTYEIADADDTEAADLEWHADEFYGRLQDFIAESKFGWGELRGG
jgi:hypothetical protein